jgi:hypothetical protein
MLGKYDPMQPKDSDRRLVFNAEKIQAWIAKGARPPKADATDGQNKYANCHGPRNGPPKRYGTSCSVSAAAVSFPRERNISAERK